jgi:hypothetical protein
MNRSAQRKVLIILIVLLFLSLSGLGYWYFFIKNDGISISVVSNDWGEYNELYEYRTKEENTILRRSFTVNVYTEEILEEDGNGCVPVDLIVYNMEIADNLEKEISFCEYGGDVFEEGLNYEVTFSRELSEGIVIESKKIDVEGKREEYLYMLFEIMRDGYDLEGLGVSKEEISKVENSVEGVEYRKDALELVAAKKLLEEEWLSAEQRGEVQDFIDFNKDNFSLEDSYLPCYTAKELGWEYTSVLEQPDMSNNIVNDGDINGLIESLYLEGALPPAYNDNLRLFADDIKYCKSMSDSEYLKLYEDSINYLYNFHNINEETIFWLREIGEELGNIGYQSSFEDYLDIRKALLYNLINSLESQEYISLIKNKEVYKTDFSSYPFILLFTRALLIK